MVIMWPQCSAIPECPNQVNLCFLKKKERETDRGDRKTEVNITRVSAAYNYIMYTLGIKSVNTFKTLTFTLNLKPKLKKSYSPLFKPLFSNMPVTHSSKCFVFQHTSCQTSY